MFLTLNLNVLGPTESLKKKVNDQYRFSLTIKHQEKDIKKMIESVENIKQDDIKISYDPMIER
jgi:primosomal protein N'